jgi:hypothetical protein
MTRRAQIAVLTAAVLVMAGGPAAPASAQSSQLEPTIIVSAATGAVATTQTTLVSGRTYQLVVEGTYLQRFTTADGGTFTYTHDGVYCFEDTGGGNICSASAPKLFDSGLRARQGQSGNFQPFYRGLGPQRDAPGLKDSHHYDHEFVAGATAPLELVIQRQPNDTYIGELRVTLYGPPSPGSSGPPPPPEAPSLQDLLNSDLPCGLPGATPLGARPESIRQWLLAPPTTPVRDFCPRSGRASEWNVERRLGNLSPGDEAIVESPPLGADQRSATITLTTSKGDVAVALSLDDKRFRRFAQRGCYIVAVEKLRRDLRASGLVDRDRGTNVDAGGFTGLAGLARYLLPCLQMIDDHLAGVKSSARMAAAGGCGALSFPVKAVKSANPNVIRFRVRRGDPIPRELRVSCRATATGLEVRVRPRRAGIALRRVVGSRFAVGLARHPRATGADAATIAFRR